MYAVALLHTAFAATPTLVDDAWRSKYLQVTVPAPGIGLDLGATAANQVQWAAGPHDGEIPDRNYHVAEANVRAVAGIVGVLVNRIVDSGAARKGGGE